MYVCRYVCVHVHIYCVSLLSTQILRTLTAKTLFFTSILHWGDTAVDREQPVTKWMS